MSFENILCYGTLNPDLIYFVNELPSKGDDIRSSKSTIRPGGTAINCSELISLWSKSVQVRGNSIGSDPMGNYLIDYLKENNIKFDGLIIDQSVTPTCSIFVDSSGERTIVSSGYEGLEWSNFENLSSFDSLMLDRYSIRFVKDNLKNLKKLNNLFVCQAGYEYEIDYKLDFLIVSKDEISVNEANNLIDSATVEYILLTSSSLPARLISSEGAIEIVPPDFKTINSNGAGDATAAYIAAFGISDLITNIKKACAAGAIVAGTNERPTLEKIEEISQLIDVNPR
jgi:ribokinase